MNRGFYTSVSAMMVGTKKLNDIANNMVNVTTTGYKKDTSITTQFSDLVINKVNENIVIGNLQNQVCIDDMYTEGNETCTYYGGLKYIVKKLKETYPLAMIILIGNTYTTTRVSSKVDEFNKAKKDIADLYNVLYLDMARETGFNLSFESMVTELQLNSIHPNYKAHEIMGSRLTGFIASH